MAFAVFFLTFSLSLPSLPLSLSLPFPTPPPLSLSLSQVWQTTVNALRELAVVAILTLCLPKDNSWAVLGLGTQALIVGLAISVLSNSIHRLKLLLLLTYNYVTDPKQRTRRHFLTLSLTFLLLPLSLLTVLLSSVLSTPVFPLFTLPILLPSFPRMRTFWPRLMHTSSTTEANEAVFYQQMKEEIARTVFQSLSSGSMRYDHANLYLLVRFQDRLAFVTILEQGYGYCTIHLKGLELQETSCHTTEASRVDEMIEAAYSTQCRSCSYWVNTYPMHTTLQLLDSSVIHTYSDARNTLSGIIDQPDYLKRFSDNLMKALTWAITHHCLRETEINASSVSPRRSSNLSFSGERAVRSDRVQPFEAQPIAETALEEEDSFSWSHSVTSLDENVVQVRPSQHATPQHKHTTTQYGGTSNGIVTQHINHHGTERAVPSPPLSPLFYKLPSTVAPSEVSLHPTSSTSVQLKGDDPPHTKPTLHPSNKVFPMHSQESLVLQALGSIPFTSSELAKGLNRFDQQWFNHVLYSGNSPANGAATDQIRSLVVACFLIMDVPTSSLLAAGAHTKAMTRPGALCSGFQGDFTSPYTLQHALRWMKSNQALFKLAVKAYR